MLTWTMRRFGPISSMLILLGAGALGQQLGVTGVGETGQVHGGLVERRGHDGVRLACMVRSQAKDIVHRRPPGRRANLADQTATSAGRLPRPEPGRFRGVATVPGDSIVSNIGFGAHPARGPFQQAGIADHEWAAAVEEIAVGECLEDDLGADPGRIAHGDRQQRAVTSLHADRVQESIMRHQPCGRSLCTLENACGHPVRCARIRAFHDDRIAVARRFSQRGDGKRQRVFILSGKHLFDSTSVVRSPQPRYASRLREWTRHLHYDYRGCCPPGVTQ